MPRNRYKTTQLRKEVLERDGRVCYYCGTTKMAKGHAQLDHIIPIAQGGKDALDNLVIACKRCNTQKSNLSLEVYAARRLAAIERERARLLTLLGETE